MQAPEKLPGRGSAQTQHPKAAAGADSMNPACDLDRCVALGSHFPSVSLWGLDLQMGDTLGKTDFETPPERAQIPATTGPICQQDKTIINMQEPPSSRSNKN